MYMYTVYMYTEVSQASAHSYSCQQSQFERDSHNFEAVFIVPPDRHFQVPIKPTSTTISFDRQDYHYKLAE